MSKSKNWKAVIEDTLKSSDLTLTVSGEINTGGIHQHQELIPKVPQGITKTQLILEAKPISDTVPEVFVPVEYKEKLFKGRHQYTSILIVAAKDNEKLAEITKIEQHIS